jgi:hypothetical protein
MPCKIKTHKRAFSCTPDHCKLGYDKRGDVSGSSSSGSGLDDSDNNGDKNDGGSDSNHAKSNSKNSNIDENNNNDNSNNNDDGDSRNKSRIRFTVAHSSNPYPNSNHHHNNNPKSSFNQEHTVRFPIPFKVPPDPYIFDNGGLGDIPWVWDMPYGDLRDRFGRKIGCDRNLN